MKIVPYKKGTLAKMDLVCPGMYEYQLLEKSEKLMIERNNKPMMVAAGYAQGSWAVVGLWVDRGIQSRKIQVIKMLRYLLKRYVRRFELKGVLTDCPPGMERWLRILGFVHFQSNLYKWEIN